MTESPPAAAKPDFIHFDETTIPWRDSPLQPGAQIGVLHGEGIDGVIFVVCQHEQADAFIYADDIVGEPVSAQVVGGNKAIPAPQGWDAVVVLHCPGGFIGQEEDGGNGSVGRQGVVYAVGAVVVAGGRRAV